MPSSQRRLLGILFKSKLIRDFSSTMLWQLLGKLFQVVGMVYATRCLGPDNIGVSRAVITLAMTLQLCLAVGLDAVAVRHVAKGLTKAGDIASAIFTFRFVLGFLAALFWAFAVSFSSLEAGEKWTWLAGALFLLVCCMDYSWIFQATEQMPRASRFQLASSMIASIWFVLFFHKGQSVGSDLYVLLVANAIVVAVVWWKISNEFGFRCFSVLRLSSAKKMFLEAWLIWLFNLGYYLLANIAQIMTYFILGKESSGLFGSAQYLVLALQMFLHYFGILMAPRLMAWHKDNVFMFRRRVFVIAGIASFVGVLVFGFLWLVVDWLYPLLYGDAFTSASGLLPWLVLGKFFAVGTAMFTWGLWAQHRDKLPVLCCLPCCFVSAGLYFILLPKFGNLASAWITLGAETTLLISSGIAFTYVVRGSDSKSPD